MNRVIQFASSDIADAKAVVQKLKDLQDREAIVVSSGYLIAKDQNGHLHLQDMDGNDLDYAIYGNQGGSIVGTFYPIPLVMSSKLGEIFGFKEDMSDPDIIKGLIQAMGDQLADGHALVITEIFEENTTPIDEAIGKLAIISRVNID